MHSLHVSTSQKTTGLLPRCTHVRVHIMRGDKSFPQKLKSTKSHYARTLMAAIFLLTPERQMLQVSSLR